MAKENHELRMLHEQCIQDLTSSEARFRSIIEKSADGIIIVDKEGIICFVNPAGKRLFARTSEDLLGSVFGFPLVAHGTTEIDIVGSGQISEMRVVETEWDGEPAYLASIRDITDRKRAEEELREREEQLRVVLEAVKEGITFSNEAGHFVVYNSEMENITGYTIQEANSCDDFSNLLYPDPEDRMSVFDELSKIVERGTASEAETRIRTKDGATKSILVSTTLLPYKGHKMFLSAYRDITDRKRAEEELRNAHTQLEKRVEERTVELRAANEELKTFAYIISHDMRSPLVNIKGFSDELRYALDTVKAVTKDALPSLKEEEREKLLVSIEEDVPEALGYIDSSEKRMNNLIAAILKLSRLGRKELRFSTVHMNDIVQVILDSLAYQIEQKHIHVTIGELPDVVADPTAMEQIMGNILENALTYVDPQRAGMIDISGEKNYDYTLFHIRDNGRGMAHDDIPKIFEIFSRVGQRDATGEGMGLAYVQTLVRRHGGKIWCESSPGEGSTFTFSISNLLKEREKV